MILDTISQTIRVHKLLERGDRVLVAFSGGSDSTALVLALMALRKDWALELSLGHFNHRLRKAAEDDVRFIRNFAKAHGLPLFVGAKDVRSHARKNRLNLEEAARVCRYDFLIRTAQEIGGAKVATGHTMNDQAETLLMRLLRGSGLKGLGGIAPQRDRIIIRPLLGIRREEVAAFLAQKGVACRVDASNFDRRLLRNRVRMDLIPYLQEHFEPNIVGKLGRLADILREDDLLLDRLAKGGFRKVVTRSAGRAALDAERLSRLPRGVARRVVRDFIAAARGHLRGMSFQSVESVLSMGQGELHLKKDLVLEREAGLITVKRPAPQKKSYTYAWDGETPLVIPEAESTFHGRRVSRKQVRLKDCDDDTAAFLDGKTLRFPLQVRSRKPGDRYHPCGAPGRSKLKEIMRAKGIPRTQRDRRPVFCSEDEILWVPGLPVSETHKVTSQTREVFIIRKIGPEVFPGAVPAKG